MISKILFVTIFILASGISFSQNVDIREWRKIEDKIEISTLPKNIRDSLQKYNKFPEENIIIFKVFGKYFSILNLKDDKFYLCSIDTAFKKFKIFLDNKCCDVTHFMYFFVYNEHLYLFAKKHKNDKQFYSYLFKIDKDSIDFCNGYKFQQQDITYFLLHKWKPLIKIENGLLKVYIESYKKKFEYAWLFLWWVPRGAPKKWKIDYHSRKDYCYTLDENLNLISIEEIPIIKEE